MRYIFILGALLLVACSEQTIQRTLEGVLGQSGGGLTTTEVASGLKEALVVGAQNSVNFASVKDGFYKNPSLYIPFPEEAQKVKTTAMNLGLSSQVNKFEETLNRAAEEAVKQATPILVNAITSMTIEDAFGLLKGGENAATTYLRNKTEASLLQAFQPKVQDAVDKVELTKYWNPLASAYNTATTFTGGQAVNPDLTRYVTDHAMDGLFLLIAKEEASIRQDPAARVSDLLKKVFGSPEAKP
jgi:hypothetical protein